LQVPKIWRASAIARWFDDDGFARRAVVIASGEMLALPPLYFQLLRLCATFVFSVSPWWLVLH
jgi:hypothetical protein